MHIYIYIQLTCLSYLHPNHQPNFPKIPQLICHGKFPRFFPHFHPGWVHHGFTPKTGLPRSARFRMPGALRRHLLFQSGGHLLDGEVDPPGATEDALSFSLPQERHDCSGESFCYKGYWMVLYRWHYTNGIGSGSLGDFFLYPFFLLHCDPFETSTHTHSYPPSPQDVCLIHFAMMSTAGNHSLSGECCVGQFYSQVALSFFPRWHHFSNFKSDDTRPEGILHNCQEVFHTPLKGIAYPVSATSS